MAGHPGRGVAPSLDALPADWVVLRDVAWPGRPPATIDHVLVGPSGIFVVLVRGSDPVRGRARAGRAGRAGRPVSSGAIAEASRAAGAVAGRVPLVPRHQVRAVLCAGDTTAAPEPVGDVMVVGAAGLARTLLSHPGRLPAEHTRAIGAVLRTELEPAGAAAGAGSKPRAGVVRRSVARGALVAAGMALVAVVAQPQLVPGLTSTGTSEETTVEAVDSEQGRSGQPDDGSVQTAEVAPSATASATARAVPGGSEDGDDIDPVDEVAPSEGAGPAQGSSDPDEPDATAEPGATGGGAAGRDPAEGGRGDSGPVASDFGVIVAVLGPDSPVGMVRHTMAVVARGALPAAIGMRSTSTPGWVCLQDERSQVSMTIGRDGARDLLLLGAGTCDGGDEVARLVGRPGDYEVRGDRTLARGVAALLAAG